MAVVMMEVRVAEDSNHLEKKGYQRPAPECKASLLNAFLLAGFGR